MILNFPQISFGIKDYLKNLILRCSGGILAELFQQNAKGSWQKGLTRFLFAARQ